MTVKSIHHLLETRRDLPPLSLRGGFQSESQPDDSSLRDPIGGMDSAGFRAGEVVESGDRTLLDCQQRTSQVRTEGPLPTWK